MGIKEFTTYFTFRNKIINGWKIAKVGNTYNVYTYTTCKKLGNWQLFFYNYSYDKLLKYFKSRASILKEQVVNCNNDSEKEWLNKETNWSKDTLEQFILSK